MSIYYGFLKRCEARTEKKRITRIRRKSTATGKWRAVGKIMSISEKITGKAHYHYSIIKLDDNKIQAIQEGVKDEMISFFKRQHVLIESVPCPANNSLHEINKSMEELKIISGMIPSSSSYAEMKELLKMVERCQKVIDDRNKITRRKWHDSCKQKSCNSSTRQKSPLDEIFKR